MNGKHVGTALTALVAATAVAAPALAQNEQFIPQLVGPTLNCSESRGGWPARGDVRLGSQSFFDDDPRDVRITPAGGPPRVIAAGRVVPIGDICSAARPSLFDHSSARASSAATVPRFAREPPSRISSAT
jgi:hypothetical protein